MPYAKSPAGEKSKVYRTPLAQHNAGHTLKRNNHILKTQLRIKRGKLCHRGGALLSGYSSIKEGTCTEVNSKQGWIAAAHVSGGIRKEASAVFCSLSILRNFCSSLQQPLLSVSFMPQLEQF